MVHSLALIHQRDPNVHCAPVVLSIILADMQSPGSMVEMWSPASAATKGLGTFWWKPAIEHT